MTASALTTKNKTGPRLSGSDPHGAIQIRSFGGKMKIVNLWLMPAPSTLLADHPQAFGASLDRRRRSATIRTFAKLMPLDSVRVCVPHQSENTGFT
jgi:hypothetical protein